MQRPVRHVEKCHHRTHAPHQIGLSFDHVVSAAEHDSRDIDAACRGATLVRPTDNTVSQTELIIPVVPLCARRRSSGRAIRVPYAGDDL